MTGYDTNLAAGSISSSPAKPGTLSPSRSRASPNDTPGRQMPFSSIDPFMRKYSGRRNISRAEVVKSGP